MIFQRIIVVCFMTVAFFGLAGCDALYKALHKEGAEEKELIGESTAFEKNPTIKEIQVLLNLYGYNPGKTDGVIGARTRVAVERFQKDNGLKATRFVDAPTWEKLKIFKDSFFFVNDELNIKYVQKILTQAGYGTGVMDGKMGNRTKEAVLKFQKDHGLKPDGRIGYQTLVNLAAYVSKEK